MNMATTRKPTAKAPPKKKAPAKKKAAPKKKRAVSKAALERKAAALPNNLVMPTEAERAAIREEHAWPWKLRPYQEQARQQIDTGKKRLLLAWHRRAGKDVFCLSLARNQSRERIGSYVHFFPKHVQAKRAIWNGIDPKKSARFIDVAFADQEVMRNNTDMMIEMYNGSTWQLLGSDNYDRIVGGNIVGACFSEFALCDPRAWDYIRPMILENDGTATFISTFRGRNHMWQMAQNLKNNLEWYVDIMPCDDPRSVDADGCPVFGPEKIASERESGMSEALIQQEYFCNPEATSDGAIYGRQIEHIRSNPARLLADWNPSKPVVCIWNFDLPVFAAYLVIQPGERPTILDGGQVEFTTLGDALAHVNKERWPIQTHYLMAHQRGMASAMSDLATRPNILPMRNDLTASTMTADFLETVRLDGTRCDVLLDALSGYVRRERFDPQAAVVEFGPDPLLSWHWRLAYPLECFASLESDGDEWSKKPDYSAHDRSIKTVS
jgi:hypothetical protein